MTNEEPWAVEFAPRTRRQLRQLQRRDIERIVAAIDRLAARAPNVDLRKLEGSDDEWALRGGIAVESATKST